MTKHTSAPWYIQSQNGKVIAIGTSLKTIALVNEPMADARLIAAAPDLLDAAKIALEYIESWMEERHYPDTVEEWRINFGEEMPDAIYAQRDRVRAAIAKAEGRTNAE